MCTRRNNKFKKKKKKGESKGIRGMGSFIFIVEEVEDLWTIDFTTNRNHSSQSIVMLNRQICVTFN